MVALDKDSLSALKQLFEMVYVGKSSHAQFQFTEYSNWLDGATFFISK